MPERTAQPQNQKCFFTRSLHATHGVNRSHRADDSARLSAMAEMAHRHVKAIIPQPRCFDMVNKQMTKEPVWLAAGRKHTSGAAVQKASL